MSDSDVYMRKRSEFWLRMNSYKDNGSYTFVVSQKIAEVFKYHFSVLTNASPTGWKIGNNKTEYIWIPQDRLNQIDLEEIQKWAEFAGNQCVWLGLSKHLKPYFCGKEIDYCIAADFNCVFDTQGELVKNEEGKLVRSEVGKAEYYLKYRLEELNERKKKNFDLVMSQSIQNMIKLLPMNLKTMSLGRADLFSVPTQSTMISTIPVHETLSRKLALKLAKDIAKQNNLTFLEAQLNVNKPQIKNLNTVAEKVEAWTSIYSNNESVQINAAQIRGNTIIIVDDLYQSGATMWTFANYLKSLGAQKVYGLVCVKSMRDR